MKLMKDGITVVIDNEDVIAGYIDGGYRAASADDSGLYTQPAKSTRHRNTRTGNGGQPADAVCPAAKE